MSTILALAWQRYLHQLQERPLITKAVTSGCIASLSDYIAQRLASKAPWNWRRTLAMAMFGLVYTGPANHFWHQLVAWVFRNHKEAGTILRKVGVVLAVLALLYCTSMLLAQVALDQLVFGPCSNVLMMAYITMVVEGRSWPFTQRKIKRDYPALQINGWKLWPLASLINYKFVPLQFRVLFANIVSIFWSTFLILRARSAASMVYRLPSKAA